MKLTIVIIHGERETGENLSKIARKVARELDETLFNAMEGDSGVGHLEITSGNSDHAYFDWKLEECEP